jgi:hypothetical protein
MHVVANGVQRSAAVAPTCRAPSCPTACPSTLSSAIVTTSYPDVQTGRWQLYGLGVRCRPTYGRQGEGGEEYATRSSSSAVSTSPKGWRAARSCGPPGRQDGNASRAWRAGPITPRWWCRPRGGGVDHPRRLELHAGRPGPRARHRLDHLPPAPRVGGGRGPRDRFDEVMQAALILVAYTVGTDFKPAARAPLDTMVPGSGGRTHDPAT